MKKIVACSAQVSCFQKDEKLAIMADHAAERMEKQHLSNLQKYFFLFPREIIYLLSLNIHEPFLNDFIPSLSFFFLFSCSSAPPPRFQIVSVDTQHIYTYI